MTIHNAPTLTEAAEAFEQEPGNRKCLTVYLGLLLNTWQDGDISDPDYIAAMNGIVGQLDALDPVFVSHPQANLDDVEEPLEDPEVHLSAKELWGMLR